MGDISISEISTFAHKYLLISAQFLIEFQKKIIKLRKKYQHRLEFKKLTSDAGSQDSGDIVMEISVHLLEGWVMLGFKSSAKTNLNLRP